jgi:hypothetical protein
MVKYTTTPTKLQPTTTMTKHKTQIDTGTSIMNVEACIPDNSNAPIFTAYLNGISVRGVTLHVGRRMQDIYVETVLTCCDALNEAAENHIAQSLYSWIGMVCEKHAGHNDL